VAVHVVKVFLKKNLIFFKKIKKTENKLRNHKKIPNFYLKYEEKNWKLGFFKSGNKCLKIN